MLQKLAIAVAFVGVMRCASTNASSEHVAATTEAPIRAAEELGANSVPQAALHVQLAKDETEQAKQLVKDGKKRRAELMLMRAKADAELAVALAREVPTKAEAERAAEEVKALQQNSTGNQ